METEERIAQFLEALPANKSQDIQLLRDEIHAKHPTQSVTFFDGKDAHGKVVANPTIGFGEHRLTYANGKSQDTFRLGISANATGISIYIIGIKDKNILNEKFGLRLGKAKITGYCIRFKSLADLNISVVEELFHFAFHQE